MLQLLSSTPPRGVLACAQHGMLLAALSGLGALNLYLPAA